LPLVSEEEAKNREKYREVYRTTSVINIGQSFVNLYLYGKLAINEDGREPWITD